MDAHGTAHNAAHRNHAATRERWCLNTLTDSAEEQISDDNMPGFEIMFKAEGKQVEAKLQAYVSKKNIMGMRVTVVTGPSGSYRENDILNFLEKHMPPLGAWPPMGNFLARCIRARSDGQCSTVWLVEGIHRGHPRWWGFIGGSNQRYGSPSMDEEAFH